MLSLLSFLIHILQPILVPLCFVTAWAFVGLVLWSLGAATRDGVANMKRLHQVPCPDCQFFTGNYALKCTVHPDKALSEAAINCVDYCPYTSILR